MFKLSYIVTVFYLFNMMWEIVEKSRNSTKCSAPPVHNIPRNCILNLSKRRTSILKQMFYFCIAFFQNTLGQSQGTGVTPYRVIILVTLCSAFSLIPTPTGTGPQPFVGNINKFPWSLNFSVIIQSL